MRKILDMVGAMLVAIGATTLGTIGVYLLITGLFKLFGILGFATGIGVTLFVLGVLFIITSDEL